MGTKRMIIKRFIYVITLGLCLVSNLLMAEVQFPQQSQPPRLVNNFSAAFPDLLSAEETANLEKSLVAFSDSTSNQIVVVIVDDLQGLEPWQYATELGQAWGVGQAKEDNGVVILIKPTKEGIGRKTFIAVGYGLTAVIPDLTAKQIVEQEMLPQFKQGQYYLGIQKACSVIMGLANGEIHHQNYKQNSPGIKTSLLIKFIIIILIIIYLASKSNGGGTAIGRRGVFIGPFMGGGFGGGFGRGSDSGGFGGFGGGGFGGGGSGGSW